MNGGAEKRPPRLRPAVLIPVLTVLTGLWGVLTIAASQYGAASPLLLAGRQLVFLIVGVAVMLIAASIPFARHLEWRGFYLLAVMAALAGLPWHGVRVNGMGGWYEIGGFFLQPSELGKAVFLLVLAGAAVSPLAARRRFPLLGALALLWIVPVLLQPDFGTAAVYLLTWGVLYFATGGSGKGVIAGCGAALLMLAGFIRLRPYAARRILMFLDPSLDPEGGGWHLRQLKLAIAQGGWTGSGMGRSVWSSSYLPLAYNDSAYAAMSETLGLLGTLPALAMLALLFWSLWRASRDPRRSDAAAVYLGGAAVLLAVQSLLHIGVNVGLLPPTGLTLPLVSYGGSSLVGTSLMFGLAISAAAGTEGGSGYRPLFRV